jgi:type II secretion system protein D
MKFPFLPLFSAALVASGFAQNEASPVPPVPEGIEVSDAPVPPVVPAPPVPAPGAPDAPGGGLPGPRPILEAPGVAAPLPAGDLTIPILDRPIEKRLEYPKADGNTVAALYHQLTGERVLVSSGAVPVEINFIQDPPLTHGQAVELLKKAALMEGLVFVPSGEGVVKLVVATAGLNPKQTELPVIIDPADLPAGDEVVTYVMTLKYIKPDELVRTFTQVIGQFGPYGSIAAVPNASAVVLTENSALIRTLLELKDKIDVPSAQVGNRFVKVNFADVETLAETLNEIINAQQSQQTSAGVQRSGGEQVLPQQGGGRGDNQPPPVAGQGTGQSSGAGESTPVQIVPDTRTNQIFLLGRPVDLIFIEGLIREFDAPSDQRNYLRRKLRYLSVSEFLPVAESALARTFGTSSSAQGGARTGGSRGGATQPQAAPATPFGGGNSGGNNGLASGSSRGSSSGGRSSGGGGGAGGGSIAAPQVSNAPEPIVVGRTLLVADNITNSIVVQGPPASVEAITQLLDQLDVKADQVMISTVFGQLSLTDDLDYGVDLLNSISEDARRGVAAQNRNRTGSLPDPMTLIGPAAFPTANGLNVYAKIGGDFYAYLQALQSTGKFNIISRPTIFTGNNQRGTVSSGQRIAVPTNVFNGGNSGNGVTQSTNIEYRDVVLSMDVIPLVNSENEITLTIDLLNDEVVGSQTIDGNEIPTIGTRALRTTVTIPNNSTVVLGGLITNSDRNSVSGVPILSSIPLLGKLFSTTNKSTERSELLIFIQPKIVNSDATLLDAQLDIDNRYEVSDGVRVFNNGGVLPDRDPSKGGSIEPLTDGPPPPAAAPAPAPKASERRPTSFFQRRR